MAIGTMEPQNRAPAPVPGASGVAVSGAAASDGARPRSIVYSVSNGALVDVSWSSASA